MRYELSRRDAMAALSAAGVAAGVGVIAMSTQEEEAQVAFSDEDIRTLTALAEVLYPTAVTGIPTFVERYATGRAATRPDHAAAVKEALNELDQYAQEWKDGRFRNLSPDTRSALLDAMGLDHAAPDPAGPDAARLRYYLVNELLFALYTTPTGAELVGLENPQGFPGGTMSYQRPSGRESGE